MQFAQVIAQTKNYKRACLPPSDDGRKRCSKNKIFFKNGKFKKIVIKDVQGKEPLDVQNLKKFKKIIELYRDDIVRKWIDFFVYTIQLPPAKTTPKI